MNNEWQDLWADENFLQELDYKRRHPMTLAEKVASSKEYLSRLEAEGPEKFKSWSPFVRGLPPEERRARWERECISTRKAIAFGEKVIAGADFKETAGRR